MNEIDRKEASRLAMSHDLTIDTAMNLHKIVTDIAYDLGKADMRAIFDVVCASLWLQAMNLDR